MNKMNKKGFLPVVLSLGMVIALIVGLLLLVFGIGVFTVMNKWLLAGIAVIVLTFVFAVKPAIAGKLDQKKIGLIMLSFFVGIMLIFAPYTGLVSNTYLSVSTVQIKDEGTRILATVIPDGAQDLEITFNPDVINPQIKSQGYAITQPVTLKIKYLESYKQFYFTTRNDNTNKIYSLTSKDTGNYYGSGPRGDMVSECLQRSYTTTLDAYFTDITATSVNNLNCITPVEYGYVNAFNSGTETGGFSVQFELGSEIKNITGSEQSITMANGKAKIAWQGNLLGINNIVSPNYQVYHSGTRWFLVDANAYSNVNNALTAFTSQCMSGKYNTYGYVYNIPTVADFNTCNSQYQSVVSSNIVSRNSEYIKSISNANQEADVEGLTANFDKGVLYVNLRQPVFKPMFTVELDASMVQIVKLKGIPQIVDCIPNQNLIEAGTSVGTATIKNVGDQEGYFDFSITCTNPLISGHADGVTFSAGETKTVNYQLYGGNNKTETNSGTCQLIVKDRNSEASTSCNYNMDIAYRSGISNCTTETLCSFGNKDVLTCVNGNFVTQTCSNGCEFSGDKAVCKGSNGTAPPPVNLQCKWYQEEITTSDVDRVWYNYIGIGKPTVVTYNTCKTAGWLTLSIIMLFLAITGISALLLLKPNILKKKQKGGKRR